MIPVNYFKALSDETRFRLINLLYHYELNVNEMVEILSMGQSRISRHLKVLTDSGLLMFRRNGNWAFYSTVSEGQGYTFIKSMKYLMQSSGDFSIDLKKAKRIIEDRSIGTTRFFDSIAEDWEELKSEIIGDIDLNELIKRYIEESGVIVDLGCGTGDLIPVLIKKAKTVIGVDKSTKMLEQTLRRFHQKKKNIDLRIGEIEHLPLKNEEADLVVINMVLHHLTSPQTAMAEVFRVLRSNGLFVIVDFLNHSFESMRKKYGDRWLGFSKEEIERWLRGSGFGIQQIEHFNLKKGLRGFIVKSIKE